MFIIFATGGMVYTFQNYRNMNGFLIAVTIIIIVFLFYAGISFLIRQWK